MANSYLLNQRFNVVPSTYGPVVSMLVEFLISAGWTYQGSGAGSGGGFSATGKTFVGTGSGTNGWGNSGAWARIQDPGAGREFVIQHNNSAGAIIKYSPSAKFTGGAPSATVLPTATDEKYLRGDATGTYGAGFLPVITGGTPGILGAIWQGAALGTAPYGFWFAAQVVGMHTRLTNMMMDPIVGDAADPDPVVLVIGDASASTLSTGLAYSSSPSIGSRLDIAAAAVSNGGTASGAFAHMDVGKTAFMPVRALGYSCGLFTTVQSHISGRVEPASTSNLPIYTLAQINQYGAGINPFNNKPEYLPVLWSRVNQAGANYTASIKGWSTMCRWTCVNRLSFQDTSDSKRKICVGAWWLPWDGVTTPLF